MRGSSTAITIALLLLTTRDLSAHRRDELLQAARLAIAPNAIELQLDLTPGIELAEAVIAGIDRNRDGAFSEDEKAAFVSSVMSSIEVRIDGGPAVVPAPSVEFPDAASLRSGDGTVRLTSTIARSPLSNGAHAVSFRNDYRPESSVYLANALAPASDDVAIDRQTRDSEQRSLTIDYTIGRERFASLPVWLFGSGAMAWIALRLRY